ncbi:MAG: D-alanine--D-alanine ligase [Spirochaeta sp.]|jgi:D-alanine-D-alanine ligase|nr:D-alanine--D-alanine ligase [Spirochaeta sp.]
MNVAVLYGGRSSEHEVSLVSAAGVLRELSTLPGYQVVPIGITRDGGWYRQDQAVQLTRARGGHGLTVDTEQPRVVVIPGTGLAEQAGRAAPIAIDCVFPVLHGSYGEDGTVQGLLEMANLPYVGSGVVGSSVGMDKIRSKKLWQERGLPIVPYLSVRYDEADTPEIAVLAADTVTRIEAAFGFPVFVKPNAAGSSVGVSRVTGPDQLAAALTRAVVTDSTVLIEEALPVREIETAVLGDVTVRSFPPGEVIPTHEFYDYAAKYEDPEGASLTIPADISEAASAEIQRMSREAFTAIDGSGLARVDCFLHKEDGSVYLNEINTIPGFTPISMYPKMVEAGGVPYGELLQELIAIGRSRAAVQRRRDYAAR